MCAPRRLRSAWATAQSDQSSRAHNSKLSFLHADSEDWSDWADAQADLSLRWAHMPFCRFCRALAHNSNYKIFPSSVDQMRRDLYWNNDIWHSQRTTKPTIRHVWPSKTQISFLCIRAVWWESSLIACASYSLRAIIRGINRCHTGLMHRLIWIFAGHTGLIVGFVVRWFISQIFLNNLFIYLFTHLFIHLFTYLII